FSWDASNRELYVWFNESENPNRLRIEASVRTTWLYVLGNDIVVRGLQMRHSSTLGISNGAAATIAGSNVTVQGCTFSWADFVGIGIGGNHNKVLNCIAACNGNSGINGGGEQHTIEH